MMEKVEIKTKNIEQKEGMYIMPMGDATVIDNGTILETKVKNINPEKKINVQKELDQYSPAINDLEKRFPEIKPLVNRLRELHGLLWDIEDNKRKMEKGIVDEYEFAKIAINGDKDNLKEYLVLCRLVSKYNDERATVKRQINDITGSKIMEEKSHNTAQVKPLG